MTSSYQPCGVPNAPVIKWPNARETAPVSVATSTICVAPRRSAYVIASPRIRRPSASVFVMSTHLPLSALTTSPGRVECEPGMFSTAGATPRSGVPGASPAHGTAAASPARDPGDRARRGDHRARAGLVPLHLVHPVGWLDRDAAGVEADALAHDRQVPAELVLLALLARAHHNNPGRVVAPPPDGHEQAHAHLGVLLWADDVDPQAVLLGEGVRLLGQDLGAHIVGAAVRQRPRDVRA